MSSRGVARTKSRDSVASIAYPAAKTASHVQGRHHHRAVKGTVMPPTITPEVVVAYAQCPRKAYLLLFIPDKAEPHENEGILGEKARMNRVAYFTTLRHEKPRLRTCDAKTIIHGSDVLIETTLSAPGLQAYCDVLTPMSSDMSCDKPVYTPTLIVG